MVWAFCLLKNPPLLLLLGLLLADTFSFYGREGSLCLYSVIKVVGVLMQSGSILCFAK